MRNWTDRDIEAAYVLGVMRTAAVKIEPGMDSIDIISAELTAMRKLDRTLPELMEQLRYPKSI